MADGVQERRREKKVADQERDKQDEEQRALQETQRAELARLETERRSNEATVKRRCVHSCSLMWHTRAWLQAAFKISSINEWPAGLLQSNSGAAGTCGKHSIRPMSSVLVGFRTIAVLHTA